MTQTITILIGVALALVVLVLLIGVFGFARHGDFNRKDGNKLRRARLVLQAVAVVLLLLFWISLR